MDHQAFAQLLGNYGEFVGALAVVATLAYLAVQVRQNTRTVQSSTLQASTDAINEVNLTMATDPDLIRILSSQASTPYGHLTDEDRARYHFIMLAIFRVRESLFFQNQDGTATDESLSRFDASLRPELKLKGESVGDSNFSPDFLAYINPVIEEG